MRVCRESILVPTRGCREMEFIRGEENLISSRAVRRLSPVSNFARSYFTSYQERGLFFRRGTELKFSFKSRSRLNSRSCTFWKWNNSYSLQVFEVFDFESFWLLLLSYSETITTTVFKVRVKNYVGSWNKIEVRNQLPYYDKMSWRYNHVIDWLTNSSIVLESKIIST